MRGARSKVRKGEVVHEMVEVDDEDEAAIASAIIEIRAGRYVTAKDLRAFLRRRDR